MSNVEQKASEPTEEVSEPIGQPEEAQEPLITKVQQVADSLDGVEETDAVDNIVDSEESEELSDEEIDNIINEVLKDENTDTSESEEDESPELSDEEPSNKDGFKKGLEKVKNQRDLAFEEAKAAKAENDALKQKLSEFEEKLNLLTQTQETKDEKTNTNELSDKQLASALQQFVDEGDFQGVMDIFDYKLDRMEKGIIKKYEQAEQEKIKSAQQSQVEWQTILREYSPEMYQNDVLKNDPSFDIRDNKSALYKLSDEIYTKGFKSGDSKYTRAGGMKAAVEEAFIRLLKETKTDGVKKSKSKTSDETEGLKRRLAKEHRKNTVNSGASSIEDSSAAKPKPVTDELADYIAERKKHKGERIGTI